MENIYIKEVLDLDPNAKYDGKDVYAIKDIYDDEIEYPGYFKSDSSLPFYWLKEAKQLRIYKYVSEKYDHKYVKNQLDFTIMGLKKVSPSYERGRKTKSLYECVINGEIVVEKIFKDVRDENGILTYLQVIFNWYCEDNTIGLTKTEVVKSFNKYQAETEERKRRERQIDYLVAGAKSTPIEANINAVFDLLYDEVLVYKEKANPAPMVTKLDSIAYNPSPVTPEDYEMNGMWYVLNSIPLPRVDDPSKVIYVIQSIKYQIGVMTLAEIEAENV